HAQPDRRAHRHQERREEAAGAPLMNPERPQIRELLPEEIWERLFTALRSLDEAQDRIDALTAQVEALVAALRQARGEAARGSWRPPREAGGWRGPRGA